MTHNRQPVTLDILLHYNFIVYCFILGLVYTPYGKRANIYVITDRIYLQLWYREELNQ
jgi:hypothetical protein